MKDQQSCGKGLPGINECGWEERDRLSSDCALSLHWCPHKGKRHWFVPMEVPLSSRSWIDILWYVPYCVTNAMQLFTIMGTSFLQSCWSCNALPSVPAAFSIAVCQTVKSNLVCPWMYSVLWSLRSTSYYNFALLKITLYTDYPKIHINVILSHTLKEQTKALYFTFHPPGVFQSFCCQLRSHSTEETTNSVFQLFQVPRSPIPSLNNTVKATAANFTSTSKYLFLANQKDFIGVDFIAFKGGGGLKKKHPICLSYSDFHSLKSLLPTPISFPLSK